MLLCCRGNRIALLVPVSIVLAIHVLLQHASQIHMLVLLKDVKLVDSTRMFLMLLVKLVTVAMVKTWQQFFKKSKIAAATLLNFLCALFRRH